MGLRDWWDRLRGHGGHEDELAEDVTASDAWGDVAGIAGARDPDDDPYAIGIEYLRPRLDDLRWWASSETVPVSRMGLDPTDWPSGDIRLENERVLAHEHEALRDELASHVGDQLRDMAQELWSRAARIAELRDRLRRLDKHLVETTSDHDRLYRSISRSPTELGRYHRLRSRNARALKWLIGAAFVLTELFLSGRLFESALGVDIPGLGFVVALGLMVLLIVVPHYAAAGLREGMTQYHAHRSYDPPEPLPNERALHVHFEEEEDKGFRVVAGVLLVVLVFMIVPLSWLRAAESPQEELFWPLFGLYASLQLGISGYFFLREWFDHSAIGHDLKVMAEHRDLLDARREYLIEDYSDALTDFHEDAEELLHAAGLMPRWDNYIVQQFHATLSAFRAGVGNLQPDLAPFLADATKPGLGSSTAPVGATRRLDPVSNENPTLSSPGPRGRDWWTDTLIASVARLPEAEAGMYTDAGWKVTRAPFQMLEEFLDRFYGIELTYRPPMGLTEPAVPSLPELVARMPDPTHAATRGDGNDRS